jgi:PIN domain nuclease of toxin-antitoxin system
VRVLLDTHVFLWFVLGSPKLKRAARKMIEDATAVFVSSASIWEISIKASLGKLDVDPALLVKELEAGGFLELPVRAHHAVGVAALPRVHSDSFDRLLVAQALAEPLALLTVDESLRAYGSAVIVLP